MVMMKPRPGTLLPLQTERLLLRAMLADDAPALFAIYGDPEVMRYAADEPFPDEATVTVMLRSVARLLAAGEALEWAVVERASGQLVGTCGLHSFDEAANAAEVGCMLARAAWGRGMMREALGALFRYAHDELGITQLRADIDAPNSRSIRLFTQLGFAHAHGTIYTRELGPQ
jgi:[ribosomal protein S5]-alanine N-acetyltransferase